MLRTLFRFSVLSAAVLGLNAQPVTAHHSFSMFDLKKTVTIRGTVREFQWTNPHVFLEVTVPDGRGGSKNWSAEAGAPNILARGGWSRSSFKAGDQVEVELNPLRSGAPGGALVSAKKAGAAALRG
jgi:hypothetical protein